MLNSNPQFSSTSSPKKTSRNWIDKSLFAKERLLITGGSGFIGTNVIDECLRIGWDICNLSNIPPYNRNQNAHWSKADLLDKPAVLKVFNDFKPTLVIHLGARTDLNGSSVEDYAANTQGVHNVIDAVETVGPKRVIYASSRLVFHIGYKPLHDYDYSATTFYGMSKIETEKIIRKREGGGVPWVLVRPTSIWGPWFKIPYRSFFTAIQQGRYLHPRGHQVQKSFGFVGNTVHQLLCLSTAEDYKVNQQVFFLADYKPLDILDWAKIIQHELGAPRIKQVPYPTLKFIALLGDIVNRMGAKNVPLNSFRLNNLVCNMVYDLAPLEKVVGPLPYSLLDGVHITSEWIKSQA